MSIPKDIRAYLDQHCHGSCYLDTAHRLFTPRILPEAPPRALVPQYLLRRLVDYEAHHGEIPGYSRSQLIHLRSRLRRYHLVPLLNREAKRARPRLGP